VKVVSRKTGGIESMDIMPSSANEYLKAQTLILIGGLHLAWMTNRGLVITESNKMLFFHLLAMLLWRGSDKVKLLALKLATAWDISLPTQLSFSETQSLLKSLQRCGVTNSQTQLTRIIMILLSRLTGPDPYGSKTVRAVSRQTEISSSPPPRRRLFLAM
jgi:hypothetical protein